MPQDRVPVDRIEIPIGALFEKSWPLTDADTGLAGDPTGWNARCNVRVSYGGALVTRFHSDVSKGWDGSIVMTVPIDGGNLLLSLSSAKTTLLTPIDNAVFDVEVIDSNGVPYRIIEGRAFITPEVTTDA